MSKNSKIKPKKVLCSCNLGWSWIIKSGSCKLSLQPLASLSTPSSPVGATCSHNGLPESMQYLHLVIKPPNERTSSKHPMLGNCRMLPGPLTTPKSTSMGPSDVSHSSMTCDNINKQKSYNIGRYQNIQMKCMSLAQPNCTKAETNTFPHLRQISLVIAMSCFDSIGLLT
jgi:hypothetical protein